MVLEEKMATFFMDAAFKEAEKAFDDGEVPVGCVIVVDNRIIARGSNLVETLNDPTAHAEIITLGAASDFLGYWKMEEAMIFVTLEPCVMCTGAILNSRIHHIYYAASDPRLGACGSRYDLVTDNPYINNVTVYPDINPNRSIGLLQSFFKRLRDRDSKNKKENN